MKINVKIQYFFPAITAPIIAVSTNRETHFIIYKCIIIYITYNVSKCTIKYRYCQSNRTFCNFTFRESLSCYLVLIGVFFLQI